MKIKISLLLVTFLFLMPLSAEAGVGEKVIGTTIKTVVKGVVALTNLEKVKKKIVYKLDRMDEKEFRARYAKFYELIKDLPQDIKAKYKVTPRMTKLQMTKNIKSATKKEIYRIISRIPDKTAAALFKEYLREIGRKPSGKG